VYHSTFVKLSQVLEYYGGGESAQSLKNESISEVHQDVHYKATGGECNRLDWTCSDQEHDCSIISYNIIELIIEQNQQTHCIPAWHVCDSANDCPDKSDEQDCPDLSEKSANPNEAQECVLEEKYLKFNLIGFNLNPK